MRLIKFAAGTAIILALTASAASARIPAGVPYGAGLGWEAYRGPGPYPYPPRMVAPRLGYYGTYWSGGQQEHVAPHK
jgi:hypothetical protein